MVLSYSFLRLFVRDVPCISDVTLSLIIPRYCFIIRWFQFIQVMPFNFQYLFSFLSYIYLRRLTKRAIVFSKYVDLFLIVFFLVFLFLLSSKLVIAFFLVYFLYAMIKSFLFKSINAKFIVISLVSLVGFFFVYFFHTKPHKQPVQRNNTN